MSFFLVVVLVFGGILLVFFYFNFVFVDVLTASLLLLFLLFLAVNSLLLFASSNLKPELLQISSLSSPLPRLRLGGGTIPSAVSSFPSFFLVSLRDFSFENRAWSFSCRWESKQSVPQSCYRGSF